MSDDADFAASMRAAEAEAGIGAGVGPSESAPAPRSDEFERYQADPMAAPASRDRSTAPPTEEESRMGEVLREFSAPPRWEGRESRPSEPPSEPQFTEYPLQAPPRSAAELDAEAGQLAASLGLDINTLDLATEQNPQLFAGLKAPSTDGELASNMTLTGAVVQLQEMLAGQEAAAIEAADRYAHESLDDGDPEAIWGAAGRLLQTAGDGPELHQFLDVWNQDDPSMTRKFVQAANQAAQNQTVQTAYEQHRAEQARVADITNQYWGEVGRIGADVMGRHPDDTAQRAATALELVDHWERESPEQMAALAGTSKGLEFILDAAMSGAREVEKGNWAAGEQYAMVQPEIVQQLGLARTEAARDELRARWASAGVVFDGAGAPAGMAPSFDPAGFSPRGPVVTASEEMAALGGRWQAERDETRALQSQLGRMRQAANNSQERPLTRDQKGRTGRLGNESPPPRVETPLDDAARALGTDAYSAYLAMHPRDTLNRPWWEAA